MEQVQIEYCEMDIWNVHEFNFWSEEVEEFTRKWSQSLVNVRSPRYLKEKTFEFSLLCSDDIFSFSFKHGDVLFVWVKNIYI